MHYNIDFTVASLLVLALLLLRYQRNVRENATVPRFFPLMIIYVAVLGLLDLCSVIVLANPAASLIACTAICSLYLACEVMSAALFTLYLPLAIYGVTLREERSLKLAWIPSIIMVVVIAFVNAPTGLLFSISDAHYYVPGPSSFLVPACYLFYMGMTLFIVAYNRKRIESYRFHSIAFMLAVAVLGMVLQGLLWDIRLVTFIFTLLIIEMYLDLLVPETRFDALTGLYGKRAFAGETHKMLSRYPGASFVIVYSNIVGFKAINALQGEITGDRILSGIGHAWKRYLSDTSTVCRLRDDRFVACMPLDDFDIVDLVEMTSNARMNNCFGVNVHMVFGLYVVEDRSISIGAMCDLARLALDKIGDSHVQRYAFYRPEQRDAFLKQHAIADDMEKSLEDGCFEVYLQPICNLESKEIIAAEALVRWNHPVKGLMSPNEFIPAFEHNGLITKLDRFVLEAVCALQRRRLDGGLETVPITVNVSRVDIDETLGRYVTKVLGEHGIPGGLVLFEVTESAFVGSTERIGDFVDNLHAAGSRVLVDDFGTGYSSLSLLDNASFDYMKIDREFASSIFAGGRSRIVAESIIDLAGKLGLSVIVEGIETQDMLDTARALGSEYGQGFLFSHPVSTPEFLKLLDACEPFASCKR